MNCARDQMTVEAQWRGRAMKMELTGVSGVCPHQVHMRRIWLQRKVKNQPFVEILS